MPETVKIVSPDPTICFCARKSLRQLKEARLQCSSLPEMQRQTKAGLACGGCRISLENIFQEMPIDIHGTLRVDDKTVESRKSSRQTSTCFRPGKSNMFGLFLSDGTIESTLVASNAVPPQLGDCVNTMGVEIFILNGLGQIISHRRKKRSTNHSLVINSWEEDLPRPFYGSIALSLGRKNVGAARFNVFWSYQGSVTATHENAATGRPIVAIPVKVNKSLATGPNEIFVAFQNPHEIPSILDLQVFDLKSNQILQNGSLCLAPRGTHWMNATECIYMPVLQSHPDSELVLHIRMRELNYLKAPAVYFFIRNKVTQIWNGNHV